MKRALLAASLLPIMSCASIELHFRQDAFKNRPELILVGPIESRSLAYLPYAAANLRESLRYEFFRRGFRSELLEGLAAETREGPSMNDTDTMGPKKPSKRALSFNTPDREALASLCERHSADMIILGSFSESHSDDYADTKTTTLVSLIVYARSGEMAGEVRYLFGDSLADPSKSAKTAAKLAGAILSRLP
jgi:hypothetical protein